MTTRRLDRCDVPSPCAVSWNSMIGPDVTRTCAFCAREVHDLSALTTAEAEALIFRDTERVCVRYVRGADGVIQTKDRPARMIQKGPYAGLSAAALAAAVALSQPACAAPASQRAPSERQTTDGSRAAPRPGSGTLSGRVDGAGSDVGEARVVVISESTGEEHVVRTRDGVFSLELPPGSYTISVTHELAVPTGEGGVEVQSGRSATREFELRLPVLGEVIRLYPDTPPPPLPALNERPAYSSSNTPIVGAWNRLLERVKSLLH
jgi:Carboxypeptidase regulatory-like domain